MRGIGGLMARCGLGSFVNGAAFLLILGLAAMAQPDREPPAGFPGGRFEPPKPGEIIPRFVQHRLALTPVQEKQVSALQKDVDARLAKILTVEQKKTLAERPGPGFGPPGSFGGPGGFPPGRGPGGGFQTVRLDEIKRAITATDEEWKVIGPKLQNVIATRQVLASETRGGDAKAVAPGKAKTEGAPNGDRPGTGEVRRPGGSVEGNAITQAHADFKAVLEDPKHTKAQLQEAADDVRKAREHIRANLHSLQKDLRQLLTADQEMILVGLGYLD